jgi:hypothetical protein
MIRHYRDKSRRTAHQRLEAALQGVMELMVELAEMPSEYIGWVCSRYMAGLLLRSTILLRMA